MLKSAKVAWMLAQLEYDGYYFPKSEEELEHILAGDHEDANLVDFVLELEAEWEATRA